MLLTNKLIMLWLFRPTSDAPDDTRDADDAESDDGRERHSGLATC